MHLYLLLLLALAIPVAGQEPQLNDISPFVGTWKLNLAESKLGTLQQPARLAVTFAALGSDGMKVSFDQVYGDSHSWGLNGEIRFEPYNQPANGFPLSSPPETSRDERRREYLAGRGNLLRPPIALFVSVQWVNDHALFWTFHTYDFDNRAEGATLTLTTTVSEDGKQMTGIGSDGTVQVFDKQ